jgi:hypothetical protein
VGPIFSWGIFFPAGSWRRRREGAKETLTPFFLLAHLNKNPSPCNTTEKRIKGMKRRNEILPLNQYFSLITQPLSKKEVVLPV